MIKKAFVVLLMAVASVLVFSCTVRRPVASAIPENNDSYKVHYLFEHDGCKVYRFRDQGNYVYFTNCHDDVTAVTSDSTQIRMMGAGQFPGAGQTDMLIGPD